MAILSFFISFIAIQLLAFSSSALVIPSEQQALRYESDSVLNVRAELHKAEIIPTVIDDFIPAFTLEISWPNATSSLGNTVDPDKTQSTPNITLNDDPTSSLHIQPIQHALRRLPHLLSDMTYTVAMTDPDAPSRDNPEWSEICHWIATNVPLSSSLSAPDDIKHGSIKEVMPYKPPGPPPKTGKHRYVYIALAPSNGTTKGLDLEKPDDRQHWGYDGERMGLRQWAKEMGLTPVAANFIYAQNAEQ